MEPEPKTPSKPIQSGRTLETPPRSSAQRGNAGPITPSSHTKVLPPNGDDDDFDWSTSGDQALVEAAQAAAMAPPQTPRKAPRTPQFTSPGKRDHSQMLANNSSPSTSPSNDDVFNTPSSSDDATGLLSPIETPARIRSYALAPPPVKSSLAADALRIVEKSRLSHEVEQELVQLLETHDLRTQGIARGRDISRLALSNKDKKISELEARIASLEAERETSRAVIAHLKTDILQTSPKKGRKRVG